MRIAICDDEKSILNELEKYVNEYFTKKRYPKPNIRCFNNADEFIQTNYKAEIAFLDIEMPGTNGIILANKLHEANANCIVFIITSYSEYLDEAFRAKVFRYLSKPIEKMRLFRNLDDALAVYNQISKPITFQSNKENYTINPNKIVMIYRQQRKYYLCTETRKYIVSNTIEQWFSMLPESMFFKSHKSYLVNYRYVDSFTKDTISLCNNKYKAFLSTRLHATFKKSYLMYIESSRGSL